MVNYSTPCPTGRQLQICVTFGWTAFEWDWRSGRRQTERPVSVRLLRHLQLPYFDDTKELRWEYKRPRVWLYIVTKDMPW